MLIRTGVGVSFCKKVGRFANMVKTSGLGIRLESVMLY